MARFKLRNGERVAFTAQEEAEQDSLEAGALARQDAQSQARAASIADAGMGRALVRLLWDMESRLRALGSQSGLAPVRETLSEAQYRDALAAYIRSLM